MQKNREKVSKEHHFSVRKDDRWKPPDVFHLWEAQFTHVSRSIKRIETTQTDVDEQDSEYEDPGATSVADTLPTVEGQQINSICTSP